MDRTSKTKDTPVVMRNVLSEETSENATVAAAHGIPFVCVPAGTHNHFTLDLAWTGTT